MFLNGNKKKRRGLIRRALAWQAGGAPVQVGGLEAAAFGLDALVDPNNAGYITVIDDRPSRRMRQGGTVSGAVLQVHGTSLAGQVKFKVFRPNGGVFDFVGESELFSFPAGGGTTRAHTFTFASPIACQAGDCFGYATPESVSKQPRIPWKADGAGAARYVYADVQSANAFSSVLGFAPCCQALGGRPFAAVTGDSLAAGYPENVGLYDSGGHNPAHDPAAVLCLLAPGLKAQNFSSGGKGWDWVLSTGLPGALASNPRVVIFHAGANDAAAGAAWVDVQARMDAALAAVRAAGALMVVDEIAPMSNQTDAVSAAMRALNGHYAEWCAANGVRLARLHDEFGQTRPSTGQLDDILAVYEATDRAHLTLAGKQRLAQLWKEAL